MEISKFYCVSLSHLGEYLVGEKRLSTYPLNKWVDHAIRQIMDLAMDTFDKERLVIPALPASFEIDAVPEAFKNTLEELLEEVLMGPATVKISREGEKMNIFLRG